MIASSIDNGKVADFRVKVVCGGSHDLTKTIGRSLIKLGRNMEKEFLTPAKWGQARKLVKSGEGMLLCGSFLFVVKRTKGGVEEKESRVHECRQRGCAPCSIEMNREYVEAINAMVSHYGINRFQFLVLTVPDVKIEGCRETFNLMNKSIQDLSRLPIWRAYSSGFAKSVEGNAKDTNRINPHANIFVLTTGKDLRNNKAVKRYIKNSPFFLSSMKAYLKNNPRMSEESYLKKVDKHLKIGHFYQPMLRGILQSVGLGCICRVVNAYNNPGYEFAKYLTKGFGVDSIFVAQFLFEMKRFRLMSCYGELKKFKSAFKRDEKEKALLERIDSSLDPVERPKGVLLMPSSKKRLIPDDCKEVLYFVKGDGKGNTKQYVKRTYLDDSFQWFLVCKWEYDCTAHELIARALFYENPADLLLMGKMQESKRFEIEILHSEKLVA